MITGEIIAALECYSTNARAEITTALIEAMKADQDDRHDPHWWAEYLDSFRWVVYKTEKPYVKAIIRDLKRF